MCATIQVSSPAVSSSSSSSPLTSQTLSASETRGFSEQLSHYLPAYPRSIALRYLGAESAFPHSGTASGWSLSQCREEAVRDLLIEKMLFLAADASQRRVAYKINLGILNSGFWYANDYYTCLTEKNQKARIDHLKKDDSFFYGRCPKGFSFIHTFDLVRKKLNKESFSYRLNPGISPKEGLQNFRSSVCFIECQGSIELAYYDALLEIFGEAKFNRFFRADGSNPLSLHSRLQDSSVFQFMKLNIQNDCHLPEKRPVQPGDVVYFRNLPLYSIRHPDGIWPGHHMVCVQHTGIQKYVGFGNSPEVMTEDQIYELFAEEFNKTPISRSQLYTPDIVSLLEDNERINPEDPARIKRAATAQFTGSQLKDASIHYPTIVGFMPETFHPNLEKIRSVVSQSLS